MLKESVEPTAEASAVTSAVDASAGKSRDVLWIDKFLAKKQAASTAGSAGTAVATPGASQDSLADADRAVAQAGAEVSPAVTGVGLADASPALARTPAASRTAPVAVPLSAEAQAARAMLQQMVDMPPTVEQQLAALADAQEPVSDALLRAIWIAFESNTRTAGAGWTYVESRHGYAPPDLALATGDAGDALLPRYFDILPPKATAVADPVRSADYGGLRYLHANVVDLGCGRRLIAAQKPVAGEIAGWHQVLVDRHVSLIVDLTRYQERENHCAYVPEQQGTCVSARGRKRLVCCTGRSRLHDLKAVRQQISIDDGNAVMRLQRLRFPGWPDHGVIAVADLIALADTIEVLSPDPRRPILVHCLAGVGRSGTLMSFMASRRKLATAFPAGRACTPADVIRIVLDTMARGRIARGPSFVQMEEQFCLLIRALLRGRPGMVERRREDHGPGVTESGEAIADARQPALSEDAPLPPANAPPGLWQRLRRWCGLA